MTKRKMVLVLVLCFSIGALTRVTLFQACGLASDSRSSARMSEAQSKRQAEKRLRQIELERRRRQQERRKENAERKPERDRERERRRLDKERRRREFEKEMERAGGMRMLDAKYALRVSEDEWKLIRPKLEKVVKLWDRSRSTVGAAVCGGPTDSRTGPSGPRLEWHRPWQDKPRNDLTEAQILARHLRMLLEKGDTSPQAFRRKMVALREARKEEARIQDELTEAHNELREILTTRQEAVLVLLRWL